MLICLAFQKYSNDHVFDNLVIYCFDLNMKVLDLEIFMLICYRPALSTWFLFLFIFTWEHARRKFDMLSKITMSTGGCVV